MASRSTKIKIVEPERSCIRPKFDIHSGRARLPAKNYYGLNMSGEGMCPADAPYLGYKDRLYCCQAVQPTNDESYKYYSQLSQNIEVHKPEPEHTRHWQKWSGHPQTLQQADDIAEVVKPNKRTKTDMRWLKSQFDNPRGMGQMTIQWVDDNMNKLYKSVSCHLLKKAHCDLRRECVYEDDKCVHISRASIQAKQRAEKAEKEIKQARQRAEQKHTKLRSVDQDQYDQYGQYDQYDQYDQYGQYDQARQQAQAKQKAEKQARQKAEKQAKQNAEKQARQKAEKQARQKAEPKKWVPYPSLTNTASNPYLKAYKPSTMYYKPPF